MATYRAQVVFPYFSNLPTDVWTNTLHFTTATPIPIEDCADAITPLLSTFYDAIYTEMGGMASYCVPANAHVNWYDLAAPPPRVPLTRPLSVTVTAGLTSIPTECSIVLSFQGDPVSGQPQARRRGRIYLGGLVQAAFTASGAATFPTINAALRTAIGLQAEALRDAAALALCRWAVWSTTDELPVVITNGWIDNTPDTQRRRGVDPSSRTLWS